MSEPIPTFHVIHLGAGDEPMTRHPAAAGLLSADDCAAFRLFPGAHREFPVLFYLEANGRACSYFRCIPDEVTVNGTPYPWAWTGDNFTEPEFRGRGWSTRLQETATRYLHDHGIGRGSVFSTEVTRHIFARLGFVFVGYARRFLLLRTISPLLAAHVRSPGARRVLNAAARPVVAAAATSLSLLNRAAGPRGLLCTWPSFFPAAELQSLFDRLASVRRVHFSLHVDLLRRKIDVAGRVGDVALSLIHEADSGDCRGYMIVRERHQDRPLAERYRDFRLMTLMDFAVMEGDRPAAAALVRHLVARFLAGDADVLEVISNDRLVNRAARRRGMVPVGKGMSFTWCVPARWNWPPELADLNAWPLTGFCGDAFSF